MHGKYVRFGLLILGVLSLSAGPCLAYIGQELAGEAKIDIEQASSLALKARRGTITDQELEKENGGSGLRYSFDVKSGNAVYEVGIDASDGKVLENDKEGPNPD